MKLDIIYSFVLGSFLLLTLAFYIILILAWPITRKFNIFSKRYFLK